MARRNPRLLQPAPPRPQHPYPPAPPKTTFYDLPAELRIQIYTLALENAIIHILPHKTSAQLLPHALTRTTKQVRHEVLPIMHARCTLRATVTDFNFAGILAFLSRIPPDDQKYLLRNDALDVRLHTTHDPPRGNQESLRKWLHYRADVCRPQPRWKYSGPCPSKKVANDLKRRVKRMTEDGKRAELEAMIRAIGVEVPLRPGQVEE